jgi:hypothetical protein
MIRLLALCLAATLLTGCVLLDGHAYYFARTDVVQAAYDQGAKTMCMTLQSRQMSHVAPLTPENLHYLAAICAAQAAALFQQTFGFDVPEAMPTLTPFLQRAGHM